MAHRSVAALVGLTLLSACGVKTQHRAVSLSSAGASLDHQSPFLKAHLRDGDVLILEHWAVDDAARLVRGHGRRLDPSRMVRDTGDYRMPLDSVALFETNVIQTSPGVSALSITTGVSLGVRSSVSRIRKRASGRARRSTRRTATTICCRPRAFRQA